MLVKEYRDGILLFQLMDEKVWSKAIEDTVGLKKYFADNQAKYQWDQRVQGTVVSAATPALLARVQKELKAGRFPITKGVPPRVAFASAHGGPTSISRENYMMALDDIWLSACCTDTDACTFTLAGPT